VRIRLNVPNEYVRLTEYSVWADFMENCKYTKPNDYKTIIVGAEEVNAAQHRKLIEDLKDQRPLAKYKVPQAIMEYIDPRWVIKYKVIKNTREQEDRKESFFNRFRR
jgi:hypothetical protein